MLTATAKTFDRYEFTEAVSDAVLGDDTAIRDGVRAVVTFANATGVGHDYVGTLKFTGDDHDTVLLELDIRDALYGNGIEVFSTRFRTLATPMNLMAVETREPYTSV
jgi:hypothetical protein